MLKSRGKNTMSTKIEREKALAYALSSLRIEGIVLDASSQEMLAKLVDGGVTGAKLKMQIIEHAKTRAIAHGAAVCRQSISEIHGSGT